jgi:hypothetical protein
MSRSDCPVIAFLSQLYRPGCNFSVQAVLSLLSYIYWLSGPLFPVLAVISRPSSLIVLSRLCRVSAVLYQLPCPSTLDPSSRIPAVLSLPSCPGRSALPIPSGLTCLAYLSSFPILVLLSKLPILTFLSWCLPHPDCLAPAVLSLL